MSDQEKKQEVEKSIKESSNKRYKILSIEDDELYAVFLRKLTTLLFNSDFHHSNTPKEAFGWLVDNKPDLILLDLELPQMDGIKTLQYIRIQLGMKDVKVIPCTTLSNSNIISKLASYGIVDYIVKTAPSKIIAEKINKALSS